VYPIPQGVVKSDLPGGLAHRPRESAALSVLQSVWDKRWKTAKNVIRRPSEASPGDLGGFPRKVGSCRRGTRHLDIAK
jgi:hypothetical protein